METMEEETMLEKERPKRSGRLFIAYTVLFTVMMLLVFVKLSVKSLLTVM